MRRSRDGRRVAGHRPHYPQSNCPIPSSCVEHKHSPPKNNLHFPLSPLETCLMNRNILAWNLFFATTPNLLICLFPHTCKGTAPNPRCGLTQRSCLGRVEGFWGMAWHWQGTVAQLCYYNYCTCTCSTTYTCTVLYRLHKSDSKLPVAM